MEIWLIQTEAYISTFVVYCYNNASQILWLNTSYKMSMLENRNKQITDSEVF
jgi:hypothetical protein